ncbi:hypothetical protein [uncultured Gordonia sp.]|uniref:hypothetical protein n=1 Tax=Gordonia sp. (in: high G+C Gram-positive bacteria) TaxID=84139 RepID=UPI0026323C17|nr:hypothetical protein [uncultured Gordonia sp.]HNP57791.1 hypothetical protein [Gordonia sp. (in: high G+C Gram-positive bacteria)]
MGIEMDEPAPLDHRLPRREVRRLLGQMTIGVGAILLAAVDDWNLLAERNGAHLRTVLQVLGRGSYVAAVTAAGTEVWLSTPRRHPPGHMVCKQQTAWPAVASRSKTYLEIHHNQAQPTNDRRQAFCTQDSGTLGLVGNPTHCELTWEYDLRTDKYVKHIWVSAPGVDWERFEVPMAAVQAQYATWRKRNMPWLTGDLVIDPAVATGLPARDGQQLRPGIGVRPRRDETGAAE